MTEQSLTSDSDPSAGRKIEASAIKPLKAEHLLIVFNSSDEELRKRGAILVEDFSAWSNLAKETKRC